MRTRASKVAVFLLLAMICFQIALAAGLPLGQFAWGGQQVGALPVALRWGSLLAAGVLGTAIWIVLARTGIVRPGPGSIAIRSAAWLLSGYLALNTFENLVSASQLERFVMTPVSLTLAVCLFVVASSPWKASGRHTR